MDLEYFMTEDYDLYRDYENLMLQLPEDSITTYGAIAKALGDIKVAKAVGFMLSRNTDGDKIKCYKVIHSDGRVGKFTHPLDSEERIRRLEKDGAIIKNGSVSNFKEKCYDAFRTDYPLKHLSDLQTQLFQDVSEKLNSDLYDLSEYNEIGAVDVSYYNQKGYGVFVYTSGGKILKKDIVMESRFPYIPGYLFFREFPFIRRLTKDFKGLILVDGNGMLHPRRMGLATMSGKLMDLPTIGIAKSLMLGKIIDDTDVIKDGINIGRIMWKKFIVSQGWGITLNRAINFLAEKFPDDYPQILKEAHRESLRLCRADR